MKQPTVLITGITGNQGGSVAKELLKLDFKIYGLTRNKKSKKAKRLIKSGVELIEADLRKPETLHSLNGKADFAFLMTDFWAGKESEILFGQNLINAIKDTCKHFIFSSTPSSFEKGLFSFSDSKYEIEQMVKKSGMRYSIVRPGLFMELFKKIEFMPPVVLGMMLKNIDGDKKLPFVSVEDIGIMVSIIIQNSEKYHNSDFNLVTENISLNEYKSLFKNIKGRKPFHLAIPNGMFKKFVSKDLFDLWSWLNSAKLGYKSPEFLSAHKNAKRFESWLAY